MAKQEMDMMFERMHDIKSKLQREIKDFASLKFIMDTQSEIRDVQSWVDAKFEKIVSHYNVLERYLPPVTTVCVLRMRALLCIYPPNLASQSYRTASKLLLCSFLW